LPKGALDVIEAWQRRKEANSKSGRETMDSFISRKREHDDDTVTHQTKRDADQ
jgi:hypothetical protein